MISCMRFAMCESLVAVEKKTALMARWRLCFVGVLGLLVVRLRDGTSRLRDRVSCSRDVTSRVFVTSRRFLIPAQGRYSRPLPRREVVAIVFHGQYRFTRKVHPLGGARTA